MSPTLEHGERLLALSPQLVPVRPGRIVVFRRTAQTAEGPGREQFYVKRALTREPGGWFVIGDGTTRSADSRRLGLIPEAEIEAVIAARIAPIQRLRWLL